MGCMKSISALCAICNGMLFPLCVRSFSPRVSRPPCSRICSPLSLSLNFVSVCSRRVPSSQFFIFFSFHFLPLFSARPLSPSAADAILARARAALYHSQPQKERRALYIYSILCTSEFAEEFLLLRFALEEISLLGPRAMLLLLLLLVVVGAGIARRRRH